jgi:hypothetical protein
MPSRVERELALEKELRTTMKLLRTGLRELQELDGANDVYHLLLLALANGFERLMKVVLSLDAHTESSGFPKDGGFFPTTHDLNCLLSKVTDRCFSDKYLEQIAAARTDFEFLRHDEQLKEMVHILSDFGKAKAARYYHLDVVLGENPSTDSPEQKWAKLEKTILREKPALSRRLEEDPELLDQAFDEINQELVASLERFTRALVRLFTLGELGDLAKRHTGLVGDFLYLRDKDLGKRRY